MKVGDVFSYEHDNFFVMGIVIKVEIERKEIWFLKLKSNEVFTRNETSRHSGLSLFMIDSLIADYSEILCSLD
jgi:hypothetical protein